MKKLLIVLLLVLLCTSAFGQIRVWVNGDDTRMFTDKIKLKLALSRRHELVEEYTRADIRIDVGVIIPDDHILCYGLTFMIVIPDSRFDACITSFVGSCANKDQNITRSAYNIVPLLDEIIKDYEVLDEILKSKK